MLTLPFVDVTVRSGTAEFPDICPCGARLETLQPIQEVALMSGFRVMAEHLGPVGYACQSCGGELSPTNFLIR